MQIIGKPKRLDSRLTPLPDWKSSLMRAFITALLSFLIFTTSLDLAAETMSPAKMMDLREDAERAYDERDAETAQALFKQMTEITPLDPDAWFGLSRAYEWNEQFALAADAAEQSQRLGFVYDSYMSYRLGRLHATAGNKAEALNWIETALSQGYRDRPGIASDAAFASLTADPQFKSLAGVLFDDDISRNDGLRFDLDYLIFESQRLHAGLDRPAYSDRFLGAADELRRTIPDASDAEVLAGFMRLTAILNDGHTVIYGPDPDSPLNLDGSLLPLTFYWFAEGIYVVDAADVATEFIGQRVVKFGDLTAEEVLQRLSVYRGIDNAMTWKWMGPQFYLGQMQMLHLIGASASADSVQITFANPNGSTSQETIKSGNYQRQRKLRPSPAMTGDTPRYLANVDQAFWAEHLDQQDAIYFQFNQVRNTDDESIADFAERLAGQLNKQIISAIIVDLRHNNGGNNTLVEPLVKTLIEFEQRSATHKIYVITGRNTFSAAQNFINRIEQWTDAVFIGEPSASSPNFVGEETSLLLPYSKIRGSISNRYWQDSQPYDQRPWISPAIPVQPTAADYFAGRDAALEAVLEIIASDRDR